MGAITIDFSQVEPGTLVTVGDELIAAEPGSVMFTLSRDDEHLVSQLYSPEEVGELAGSLLMLSKMAHRQRRRWRRKGHP